MKRILALVGLCLVGPHQACSDFSFEGQTDRINFGFEISEAQLARAPHWSGIGNPPISPGEAARIAATVLPRLVSNPRKWKVDRIHLAREGERKTWIYAVTFELSGFKAVRPDSDKGFQFAPPTPSVFVVVLMDGTIPKLQITRR